MGVETVGVAVGTGTVGVVVGTDAGRVRVGAGIACVAVGEVAEVVVGKSSAVGVAIESGGVTGAPALPGGSTGKFRRYVRPAKPSTKSRKARPKWSPMRATSCLNVGVASGSMSWSSGGWRVFSSGWSLAVVSTRAAPEFRITTNVSLKICARGMYLSLPVKA
jgi:hypothetical protein